MLFSWFGMSLPHPWLLSISLPASSGIIPSDRIPHSLFIWCLCFLLLLFLWFPQKLFLLLLGGCWFACFKILPVYFLFLLLVSWLVCVKLGHSFSLDTDFDRISICVYLNTFFIRFWALHIYLNQSYFKNINQIMLLACFPHVRVSHHVYHVFQSLYHHLQGFMSASFSELTSDPFHPESLLQAAGLTVVT